MAVAGQTMEIGPISQSRISGDQPAVGLIDRRQQGGEPLVETDMAGAQGHRAVEPLRDGPIARQAKAKRPGIEQGHVGALPELRACRMPGVADVDERRFGGARQGAVRIAREDELFRRDDLVEQRRGLWPERADVRFPMVQPGVAPGVQPVGAQRPEESELASPAAARRADRQHADHPACRPIALLQRGPVEPRIVDPVQRRPERPISQRPPGRRGQRRAGAERVDDEIERIRPAAVGHEQPAPLAFERAAGDVQPRPDRETGGRRGVMQAGEQIGAVDAETEATRIAERGIMDIENRPAMRRGLSEQLVDARTGGQ